MQRLTRVFSNSGFSFRSNLHRFFTGHGRRQGAEHLLIGWKQFFLSGVKVQTPHFLQQVLLSIEVSLTMLFLFLPISSFGRY